MLSKNHMDSSIAERRLRPIYNWLDDGNNKKALQEAEKVLKKQPNFQCAKVLKGLALLRLGKEHECQQLLNTVRNDVQYDDSTLQAMTICYREMNKPEEICDIYLAATKKDPKNEELLTHLFMAYVRINDYKKQQQTAMMLYKLKFKNHYYFWTVMSIVMQAHDAGPELAKNLQLPLAEKMVVKFVEEKKIEAEQEVQLYLMILEMQYKLKEALAVLESPLGDLLQSYVIVRTKRVELLIKMGCWKKANTELKTILVEDMDNWSLYLAYFKSIFQIMNVDSNVESIDDNDMSYMIVTDSVQFLKSVQEENLSRSHNLRGPYLAILEFFIQLQTKGIDAKIYFGCYTDLLLEYFRRFGSKTCCFNDLKPYLDTLNDLEITSFLDEIWKLIELEDGQLPSSKEQMLRYISNLHITRFLGFHSKLGVKAKLQLADCLLNYYIHGAQFNESKLLPTDIRHNDPFVILIFEIMNDIWLETNDSVYLKSAILILEHGLSNSPSNHQFKIILIKLYNILGLSKASYNIYELLDVKHVQLDSIGYLMCPPLIATGQYILASYVYESTLKFFTANYKDSADHLTFLYKFGSFLKIDEFLKFKERLNNSLHYSAISVEKMLMEIFLSSSHNNTIQIIEQMGVQPEIESISFNHLEDNRDLDLCWTSDPSNRQISRELINKSYEHDIELLRVRSITLRILCCVIQFTQHNSNQDNSNILKIKSEENHTVLQELIEQLTSLSRSLSENNYSRIPKNIINTPSDSRLFYLLDVPYLTLLETLSLYVLTILKGNITNTQNIALYETTLTSKLSGAISLFSSQCKCNDHSQLDIRCKLLNILTLLIEMISITCLFCGAVLDISKLHNGFHVKKGRRKKDSSMLEQVHKKDSEKEMFFVNTIKTILSLTNTSLQDLDNCVTIIEEKWKEDVNNEIDISSQLGMLNLGNVNLPDHDTLTKAFLDSYQSSLSEIRNVIRVKIKYLSDIHI